jgi:endonuclease/exonuclease/phosphatase family metal-dependent hydrolase
MKIKLLTLNIYRYYANWEKRKRLIINYIKQQNPDLVFLQECFDDGRYNNYGDNQAEQLNKELNYDGCVYSIAEMLRTEGKEKLKTSVFDGLGCLTRFPIINLKNLRLTQHEGDNHFRIIQKLIFNINEKNLIIYHTHYSNRDNFAKWQLEETMDLIKKEKSIPLIVGDLNIRVTDDIIKVASKIYKISWTEKNYVGYPAHNEVLDYILIPKKWNFKEIICEKDGLSDHRPLIAIINLPKV